MDKRQYILLYGLIIFSAENLVDGVITGSIWSFITAANLGILAGLVKIDGKPPAPHAKKEEFQFGSSSHQFVYERALDYCTNRIQMYRQLWRNDPDSEEGHRYWLKYDHWKDNYWLVFSRYQKSRQDYGWK